MKARGRSRQPRRARGLTGRRHLADDPDRRQAQHGEGGSNAPGERVRDLGGRVAVPHSFILDNTYAREGDIVIVAGTLIEGIGNAYSDIDVYVITDRLRALREVDTGRHHRVISVDREILKNGMPDREVLLIHTVVPGTEIKVDVEFRTFAEIDALFGRLNDLFEHATKSLILLVPVLSERQESLIHRMFHGVPILDVPGYHRMMQGIDRSRYAYLQYRWKASDFSVLIDLLGTWQNGELDRSVDIARENLITQMFAYVHLLGATNSRRKWLLREIDRHLTSPEDRRVREAFMAHLYLRGTETDEGKKTYVRTSLDLVRRDLPALRARSGGVSGGPFGGGGARRAAGEPRAVRSRPRLRAHGIRLPREGLRPPRQADASLAVRVRLRRRQEGALSSGGPKKPLVGVVACARASADPPLQVTAWKYVTSVARVVGGVPFIVPTETGVDAGDVIERIDGLYLPGAPTNVEPRRYGEAPAIDGPWDPARDTTTLDSIRAAVERGVPIFGVCRGLQEINVALGGSLHQAVHELPGAPRSPALRRVCRTRRGIAPRTPSRPSRGARRGADSTPPRSW